MCMESMRVESLGVTLLLVLDSSFSLFGLIDVKWRGMDFLAW